MPRRLRLHELGFGLGRLPPGARRGAFRAVLTAFVAEYEDRILPLDRIATTWAARFRAERHRSGRVLDLGDALIAGTARAPRLVDCDAKRSGLRAVGHRGHEPLGDLILSHCATGARKGENQAASGTGRPEGAFIDHESVARTLPSRRGCRGTFTDVALQAGGDEHLATAKVLTTPCAPEVGVVAAVGEAIRAAGIAPGAIDLLIHGTTLATNALIERTGAKTALLVTEGFRDSVEMALENRFEQYDISIDRPAPLVPRHLRWPVTERMNYRGEVLVPLDEGSVHALVPRFERNGIEAVAVGLLHSYANPAHERRVGEILAAALPELRITLSSEVCPRSGNTSASPRPAPTLTYSPGCRATSPASSPSSGRLASGARCSS